MVTWAETFGALSDEDACKELEDLKGFSEPTTWPAPMACPLKR